MSAWATRRKMIYGGGFFLTVFIIIAIPVALILYKQPTCTDGKQNGVEEGVDCGGTCPLLCTAQTLSPLVHWARSFNIKGNVYSLVAYVENPNASARAVRASYIFRVFDRQNNLLATREGTTFLPARKNSAIFEQNLVFDKTKPTRVTFEFTGNILWTKFFGQEPDIKTENTVLTGKDTAPRLDVTVSNPGVDPYQNVDLVALIFDNKENVVAASHTIVDSLTGGEKKKVTFTWPQPIDAGEGMCDVPVDVMLVIDRSGSMADDNKNPPQPLTDVKNAAESFVGQLRKEDQAGVVSFANDATIATTSLLSNAYDTLKQSIAAISIKTGALQNTNIVDAITKAREELESSRHNEHAGKVLVLLTDGAATLPRDPAGESVQYPEVQAATAMTAAKDTGIEIYTIGLGTKINSDFLKSSASSVDHFYTAATSDQLKGIYNNIATSICKKGPTTIEIVPRIYSSLNQ